MTTSISTRLAAAFTLAAGTLTMTLAPAAHADTGLTRQQVQAELAEAQRTGTLVDYETGRTLRDLFPGAYAKTPTTAQAAPAAQRAAVSSVDELPPTAAGPRTTAPVAGAAPWDYEAISRRTAELLDRAGRH